MRPSTAPAVPVTVTASTSTSTSSPTRSSAPVLRRMRRFGSTEGFLALLDLIRAGDPTAAVRSNVIVGFPGESEDDVAELERFLVAARLDAIGVFGYSDEDGTEAEHLPDHLPQDVVDARVARLTELVEELTSQRAEERVGELVEVLVDAVTVTGTAGAVEGRTAGQAPEVDGATTLTGPGTDVLVPGDLVRARVVASEGVDLVAELVELHSPARRPAAALA